MAGLLQAALLTRLLVSQVPARVVPLEHRLAVAAAIFFLVVIEIGLAITLSGAFDLLFGPRGRSRAPDLVKAAVVSTLLGLSTASALKYEATGVHLKRSDLWFGWHSRHQILQEALPSEIRALLLFACIALATGVILFLLLRRFRKRPARLPLLAAALGLIAVVGLMVLYRTSPAVARFTSQVAPEGRWFAVRASARRPSAGPASDGASRGAPIVAYRPPAASGPNLLLVMLESVPWKRTPLGGGAAGLMPHLERLASESLVFRRSYTTSGHSDYAQLAILSSLYPRKYEHHDFYTRIDYPKTLIWDALAAAGYATAMFSCQNERWGNMLAYLDTPGLGLLRHSLDWPGARHRGGGSESKVYEETPVAAWKDWFRGLRKRPWFAYLNFQATHFPYEVPPEAQRLFAPWRIDFPASFVSYPSAKVPVFVNRFNNALSYIDIWIGELRAELERSGAWEDTAMVVVSDHGEGFYEHGYPTHGVDLHEEQVRSLLVVRLPGVAPRWVDEPVSLLDLAPALLRSVGLPPHGNLQGRSDLFTRGYSGADRPLFFTLQGMTSADGVLLNDWKYLRNLDSNETRLYDLESDPDETTDLSASESERAEELDAVLRSHLEMQLGYYSQRGWEAGYYPPALP